MGRLGMKKKKKQKQKKKKQRNEFRETESINWHDLHDVVIDHGVSK